MKKFFISLFVCLLALGFSSMAFATKANKISVYSSNFNQLVITVDNYSDQTMLDWGDGSSIILPSGVGQIVNHDYAYDVGSSKSYIITLGTTNRVTATFTIDDVLKTSTFIPTTQTPVAVNSFGANEWKISSIVILPINTVIYQKAGVHFEIVNLSQDSYWLAKVIDGPKKVDNFTWWKIQLADGATGWVKELNPTTPLF